MLLPQKAKREQIKTTLRYFLPIILAKIQKFDKLGEAVGKLALSYIAGVNAKWDNL